MGSLSALLVLYEGNPPITSVFPSQGPVTQRFGVLFDLRLNKQLSKQSRRRWFETQSRSLWRHCNDHCTVLPQMPQLLPVLGHQQAQCELRTKLNMFPAMFPSNFTIIKLVAVNQMMRQKRRQNNSRILGPSRVNGRNVLANILVCSTIVYSFSFDDALGRLWYCPISSSDNVIMKYYHGMGRHHCEQNNPPITEKPTDFQPLRLSLQWFI